MAGHRAAVRVGFVGTSGWLTPRQLTRIRELSVGFAATDLHHGSRRATDAQVQALADELGLRRFVQPDDDIAHRVGTRTPVEIA